LVPKIPERDYRNFAVFIKKIVPEKPNPMICGQCFNFISNLAVVLKVHEKGF